MLLVSEVFDSVQGEGLHTGYETTFVRLAGCNLSCAWCDTQYAQAGGVETPVSDIAAKCGQRVCITGGEPLLQDIEPLIGALDSRCSVSVETNGSIVPPEWAQKRATEPHSAIGRLLWSVAPKFGSSGEAPNTETIREFAALPRVQFKFVLSDERDWQEALQIANQLSAPRHPIFLVPNGQNAVELARRFWDRMGEWSWFDARLTPQMHVLVWGQERCR